ncbi:hypothetical protein E2C01_087899 [Portunus trituberculatus]|uniref:Uncharacterized protein n=1 Tax=Portunus trituberculatus TaxID=210409 RepID=A0A5B7J4R0_PORTR|nr:hypothetical protein [Portunus trituberculatus]
MWLAWKRDAAKASAQTTTITTTTTNTTTTTANFPSSLIHGRMPQVERFILLACFPVICSR